MLNLTITDRAGAVHTLTAAPGSSLMQVISDAGLADIFGICGGARACASCHVIVDPAQFPLTGPAGADEQDLLEGSEFITATSRLSCQIDLNGALDGLRATIASEG